MEVNKFRHRLRQSLNGRNSLTQGLLLFSMCNCHFSPTERALRAGHNGRHSGLELIALLGVKVSGRCKHLADICHKVGLGLGGLQGKLLNAFRADLQSQGPGESNHLRSSILLGENLGEAIKTGNGIGMAAPDLVDAVNHKHVLDVRSKTGTNTSPKACFNFVISSAVDRSLGGSGNFNQDSLLGLTEWSNIW